MSLLDYLRHCLGVIDQVIVNNRYFKFCMSIHSLVKLVLIKHQNVKIVSNNESPIANSVLSQPEKVKYDNDGLATIHNCDFLHDPLFMKSYALGKRTNSWKNADIHWRAYIACWAANRAKQLEGDFVECGVNKGGLALTVINYTDFSSQEKKFYLLDTFCGLSEKYVSDEEKQLGVLEKCYDDCYEYVKKEFSEFKNIIIIKGIIPEILPLVKTKRVSYLSIDMNCAEPEIKAVEFFWKKLVIGAVIVIDDYGWNGHSVQKREWDKFAVRKGTQILQLPTGQGLIIK